MRTFDELFDIAAERKGGADALEQLLADAQHPLINQDNLWLEQMTKSVFQAGFNWKVIEAKWAGFQTAFNNFDVNACAFIHDEMIDELMSNKEIVRNGPKIKTVPLNAQFILDCAKEHGSFSKMVADWPPTDHIGLLELLKKRGARLGGATGQYLLRFGGKDGFILSRDVTARLIAEGIIDKPATSKTALKAVQAAFNQWAGQSGCNMTQISRVLAMSLD